MKTIKGNWIMEKDEVIEEDLKVEGNILGKDGERFNLKVKGDINAWNIDAGDIDAWNIDALNINAWDIICERRIKKSRKNKTICRVFIQDKSKIERKEQMMREFESRGELGK